MAASVAQPFRSQWLKHEPCQIRRIVGRGSVSPLGAAGWVWDHSGAVVLLGWPGRVGSPDRRTL